MMADMVHRHCMHSSTSISTALHILQNTTVRYVKASLQGTWKNIHF